MVTFTVSAFGTARGLAYSVHESDSSFPKAGFIYNDLAVARAVCADLNGTLKG